MVRIVYIVCHAVLKIRQRHMRIVMIVRIMIIRIMTTTTTTTGTDTTVLLLLIGGPTFGGG